jgi:hypothetical protein
VDSEPAQTPVCEHWRIMLNKVAENNRLNQTRATA